MNLSKRQKQAIEYFRQNGPCKAPPWLHHRSVQSLLRRGYLHSMDPSAGPEGWQGELVVANTPPAGPREPKKRALNVFVTRQNDGVHGVRAWIGPAKPTLQEYLRTAAPLKQEIAPGSTGTDYDYGYEGSSPANLALSILAYFAPYETAEALHRPFTREFLAGESRQAWGLTGGAILDWIDEQTRHQWKQRGDGPMRCKKCGAIQRSDGNNGICLGETR
jgi:hypothetical protein